MSTALNFSDNMEIKDVNGRPHPLTQYQVQMILMLGWVSFILSWICNIIFYKFHPSGVDFNFKRSKARLFLYFLGKKIKLPGYKEEGESEDENEVEVEDSQMKEKLNTNEEEGPDEGKGKDEQNTEKEEDSVEKKVEDKQFKD